MTDKEKGNDCFRAGDYEQAIKHYSDAIKANAKDAKLYSNRAACYQKLNKFKLALQDSETCIGLDDKFVKGYLRKGVAHQELKEFIKGALEFESALKLDPNSKDAMDGLSFCLSAESGGSKVIESVDLLNDPEIKQILADPQMNIILQQMQTDPKAVQEQLDNPEIKEKMVKLMKAGVIQMR